MIDDATDRVTAPIIPPLTSRVTLTLMWLIKQCTHPQHSVRPSVRPFTRNSRLRHQEFELPSKPILCTEMLRTPTFIHTVRRSNPNLAAGCTNFVILFSFVSDLVHRSKSTLNSGSACCHWVHSLLSSYLLSKKIKNNQKD